MAPESKSARRLTNLSMEVKFAATAANFIGVSIKIGAPPEKLKRSVEIGAAALNFNDFNMQISARPEKRINYIVFLSNFLLPP